MAAKPDADMSTAVTETVKISPLSYKKRLEGICATPELVELVEKAVSLAQTQMKQPTAASQQSTIFQAQRTLLDFKDQNRSTSLKQELDKENNISSNVKKSAKSSVSKSSSETKGPSSIPIRVLQASSDVFATEKDSKSLVASLESAIRSSSLAFTPPPATRPEQEAERLQFQKRLEKLRLRQEETRYGKLTQNVTDMKALQEDDVTTRSMTYAASIGLNMIVAPLSFGCFMYFFSGGILGWIAGDDNEQDRRRPGTVDIPRVIVSVISGVAMLFIEMILFVIRTHEVDKAMRSKQRKRSKQSQAFGRYTANTERTFTVKED